MRKRPILVLIGAILCISCCGCSEDRAINIQNNPSITAQLRVSPILVDITDESLIEWIGVANTSSADNSVLDWKITAHPEWITFSKTSGLVENNSEEFVKLTGDTTGLHTDTLGHIKFASNGGDTLAHVAIFFKKPIPPFLFDRTDAYLISKVGRDFFEKNLTLQKEKYFTTADGTTYLGSRYLYPELSCFIDPSRCQDYELRTRYGIVYYMEIKETPFARDIVGIDIDKDGVLFREQYTNLPDCIAKPAECVFPIDADSAKALARAAGLEEGLRPWEATFQWYTDFEALPLSTFAWHIKNTLVERETGEDKRASGKLFIIDANSGELLQILYWH